MRLWTIHPRYLDTLGLVALWRESLLARAVLRGRTVGYRRHPQLNRFRRCAAPLSAINLYLGSIHAEAESRGYDFDRAKLGRVISDPLITATEGQMRYEWDRLLGKLQQRSQAVYRRNLAVARPAAHPLFEIVPGPIAEWENVQ